MSRLLPTPRLVALDLDGTLVHTLPDLAFCTDEMLRGLGLPPAGEDRVRGWVGRGVDELVMKALVFRSNTASVPSLFDTARDAFMQLYDTHVCDRSRVYPGVREGLEFLRSHPAKLACVTNKMALHAKQVLGRLGLIETFDLVVSGDTLAEKKPSPAPLLHAAAHLEVSPADSVLIGDSPTDIEAARRAGFKIICVTYGYGAPSALREGEPDAVIDSLSELPSVFDTRTSRAG
jgi:phosphoglycolate phosphatase